MSEIEKIIGKFYDKMIKTIDTLTENVNLINKNQDEGFQQVYNNITLLKRDIDYFFTIIKVFQEDLKKNIILSISNLNNLQFLTPFPLPMIPPPKYMEFWKRFMMEMDFIYRRFYRKFGLKAPYEKIWKKKIKSLNKLYPFYSEFNSFYTEFLLENKEKLLSDLKNIIKSYKEMNKEMKKENNK